MRENPVPADPQYPGAAILTGFFLFCIATAFVILGLTGYTYQLDDIKIVGLHVGGALCLAYWALLWATGVVESPPRAVWISYLAYVAICIVSTLAAAPEAKWIGWYYLPYNFCTFGFVLLGSAVVSNRRMAEWSLKFWLLLTLITTLFGMAHYVGALERFYNMLYAGDDEGGDNRFRDVLVTFVNNRSMLSTILNVQFFGNFLLMVLPVTAACTMVSYKNLRRRLQEGDSIAVPIFFLTSAAIGLIFSVVCIFLTFSKSSILIMPLMIVGFLAGLYLFAGVKRIPHLGVIVLLSAILGGTILYFVQGDLRAQFKDIDDNIGPRKLIFGGAIEMWKDHPILGAGPGSFRIYFPKYRSPDYHLNRVSNVTVYAHNWFLDTLCETGVLGAAAYLVFLGAFFWLAIVALRRSSDLVHRVAIVGCAVGIVCLLAGASVTPMTRWPVGSVSLNAMLGTLLGIVALGLREKAPVLPRLHPTTPEGIVFLRLSVAAAALCFVVYTWNWSDRFFRASMEHNEGIRRSEFLPAPPGELKGDFKLLYEESVDRFKKALELNPYQPTTYYKLGNSYNRLGKTEEALKAFEMLKDYSPDYSEVHYNMAVIHFNMALADKEALDKAEKGKDKARIEELRKSARYHYDQCMAEFKRANEQSNKINVGFFRANTMMMAAESGLYENKELIAIYSLAGDIFTRVSALPVSTVIQEDNQVETEKDLRFRAFGLAVEAYNRAGDSLATARAAERYLGEMPTSITFLRQAAEQYKKAGQPAEALRVVDTALAANPLNPEALRVKFDLLAAGTDPQLASEHGRYMLLLDKQLAAQGEKFLPEEIAQHVRDQLKAAAASAKEKKS